jgi:hypothetical protein
MMFKGSQSNEQVYEQNCAECLNPVCKMLIKLYSVCFEIVCICWYDAFHMLM